MARRSGIQKKKRGSSVEVPGGRVPDKPKYGFQKIQDTGQLKDRLGGKKKREGFEREASFVQSQTLKDWEAPSEERSPFGGGTG